MSACLRTIAAWIVIALIGIGSIPESAHAEVFELGPVDGVLDLTFAYGLSARTQSRDFDFVGIGNGGRADSVNFDDGNLNYDKGVFANEFRFTGDLTLAWRNFGVFVRGFGFYDFESELTDRDRWIVGEVAPELVRRGITFAGLDVIGEWLTEVNVTSPTCIRELDAQYGLNIAAELFDALEASRRE